MRKLLFVIVMIAAPLFYSPPCIADDVSCKYVKDDCPTGHYCIHFEKDKDICAKDFLGKQIIVSYPFASGTTHICDQGHLAADGNSHTWENTAFALDLQGDRTVKKNSILAGVDGEIIAFGGCRTENDQCGVGFGNQVKILTKDNFIVFYAHLEEVSVRTGDIVKAGTPIGIEGVTGWTGKNNRHLHLSVHYDWRSAGVDYWKNIGYLPRSVPFYFTTINGVTLKSNKVKCNR